MAKKSERVRTREAFDAELALTNDLYQAAMKMVVACGWRVAARQVLYVFHRVSGAAGRKVYMEYLNSGEAWPS